MAFRPWHMMVLALFLWSVACSPEEEEAKSPVGGPCEAIGDCEDGLWCNGEGECYDPNADGDADGDSDGDSDADGDTDGDTDGDSDGDGDGDAGPCSLPDSDGDGIADLHEGDGDFDGDGTPNNMDLDSDADGLTDHEEATIGSSPYHADTDGDGWTDFVEYAAGTSAMDRDDFPDEVLLFILPYNDTEGHQTEELEFQTTIRIADVFFLMDTTGSMSEEIANLRAGLSGIATALTGLLDDVAMGVGRFDDFPILPYGNSLTGDRVFEPVQQMTTDETLVQAAVDSLEVRSGHDLPESHIPALWHAATGDNIGYYVPRAILDHSVPGTGRIGGVGFREDSQPIVVVVTDAPMHNNSVGDFPYSSDLLGLTAPTHAEAITALNGVGARVVGIGGEDAEDDLTTVAVDTGSVLADGSSLVYNINPDGTAPGGDLSSQVTDGIEDLILGTPQDVSTIREDDPSDAVDATDFLYAVRPLRGVPEPPSGYDSHDGATEAYGTFFGVIPGTAVIFEVEAYNDFVEEQESTQVFRLTVVVVGNGVARLDERLVVIVVPAEDAEVPII